VAIRKILGTLNNESEAYNILKMIEKELKEQSKNGYTQFS
jgi:hypothetical protein